MRTTNSIVCIGHSGKSVDKKDVRTQHTRTEIRPERSRMLEMEKDNKYLFSCQYIPDLLDLIKNDYRVLEIDGHRSQDYRTLYFDTFDHEMYFKHHRGKANRHKVRIRRYGSGKIHYLEVKKKNAKGITSKKRVQTDGMEHADLMKAEAFLTSWSPYESH